MNWQSFSDFVAMGGYGRHVWGSIGVVLAALAAEWLSLARRDHAARQRARQERDA
jgi:heme exporter protein D